MRLGPSITVKKSVKNYLESRKTDCCRQSRKILSLPNMLVISIENPAIMKVNPTLDFKPYMNDLKGAPVTSFDLYAVVFLDQATQIFKTLVLKGDRF